MRVRFAPSPTGALHIGGARTALFNWLLARHYGGELVLRIEDTDRERSTPENIEQILDALRWLELDWDEGPILQTDAHAAPRRSAAGAARLRARVPLDGDRRGRARVQGASTGRRPGYRGKEEGEGAVRLHVPADGATVVHDVIRGDTRFEHVHLDDPVIARADGSVLYNFAVAIDDLDAGITHVVRGEDHLSNTPKQVLVLEAMREAGLAGDAPLPRLRPPAAAARARRQEALQAPRRRLGAGAPRPGLPPGGGAQLPGPARVGGRGRRDRARHAGADRALHARAGQPQPGPLRRGQAQVAERDLHPETARRGADAAAWKSSPGAPACAGRRRSARRRSRRWRTSGRSRVR